MSHSLIRAFALATLVAEMLSSASAEAATCSITNAAGIAFGLYDVFSPFPVDSTGSVTYRCSGVTQNDLIYIHLSRGGSPSYLPRRLSNAGGPLSYNLFMDAARTQVWGDGSGGTVAYGPVQPADGVDVTLSVFGRIPAGQSVAVGTYVDTIVVTVLY